MGGQSILLQISSAFIRVAAPPQHLRVYGGKGGGEGCGQRGRPAPRDLLSYKVYGGGLDRVQENSQHLQREYLASHERGEGEQQQWE